MASVYHTVSDEMAWTDWSAPEEKKTSTTPTSGTSHVGAVVAFVVAFAMLAGVVFLLPAGSY